MIISAKTCAPEGVEKAGQSPRMANSTSSDVDTRIAAPATKLFPATSAKAIRWTDYF